MSPAADPAPERVGAPGDPGVGSGGGRLPRGRHGLSRAQVTASQRTRITSALADAMVEKGYANTSVADVLARAHVSRDTFYQQFDSKLDCFMAAFDAAAEALMVRLADALRSDGEPVEPVERFDRAFTAYLDALAAQPASARLFLVEVNAAGPEAIERRARVQGQMVDALARLLGADGERSRFAVELLVAAVSSMVTVPLVRGDGDALRALRGPVVDLVGAALDMV